MKLRNPFTIENQLKSKMATPATLEEEEAALLQWKPRMGLMTVADKIEQAEMLKKQANLYFKRGELKPAINRYAKIFAYINGISVQGDAMSQYSMGSANVNATQEEGEQILQLKIASWSNLAFCYVKLGTNPDRVLEFCDKVLAEQPTHSKALFRKAQALAQQKHFDRAVALLTNLATAEPKNAAVRSELKSVIASKKKYDDDAKNNSGFKNMFNKKSGGGLF